MAADCEMNTASHDTRYLIDELDNLLDDPSRFLTKDSQDVALEFADLETDTDLDLMNYFIGNDVKVENNNKPDHQNEPTDKSDLCQNSSQIQNETHEGIDLQFECEEETVDILNTTDAATALKNAINNAKKQESLLAPRSRAQNIELIKMSGNIGSKIDLRRSPSWSEVQVVAAPSEREQQEDLDCRSEHSTMSLSKAAIQAKENRAKKKQYISGLEKSVDSLTTENTILKKETSKMQRTIKTLQDEVEYLSNVLANQSTLSALLRNVRSTPGIQFSAGLEMSETVEDDCDNINDTRMKACERNGNRKRSLEVESDDEDEEWKENCEDKLPVKKQRISKVSKLDHDYASDVKSCKVVLSRKSVPTSAMRKTRPSVGKEPSKAGVCLHVSNNVVSLEFCAKCSNRATGKER